ncbi:MAG TPA: hypothetical protein VNO43_10310, partial [Candidatus Eisenbacteria bacterium]|nr:hypothetical protein [Candidatus Eisenbacteria bacterium]
SPVRPHPSNPHYLLFRGEGTLLVGASHFSYRAWTWSDYIPMLDAADAYDLNVFRVWNAASRWPDTPRDSVHPWVRSSVPGAADGGNKFDLDKWNESYFARLKDLIREAGKRGIVVEVTLLNGYPDVWEYSPLRAGNNIQGIGSGSWGTFLTLTDSTLRERQRALIRKTVEELNAFDNLYFEIMNEPSIVDPAWHSSMIQEVVRTEASLPNKHLIAVDRGEMYESLNPKPSIINSHYTYGSTWMGAMELLDRLYDADRILAADEMSEVPAHMTAADGRVEAWEFMVGGGSIYNGLITGTEYQSAEASRYRAYLKLLKSFLSGFDFLKMRQDRNVIAGGVGADGYARAISEPGKQYAIYFHHSARGQGRSLGGKDTNYIVKPGRYRRNLTLTLPPGSYKAEWISPESGAIMGSEIFNHGGGDKTLTTPTYSIDIALSIKVEAMGTEMRHPFAGPG